MCAPRPRHELIKERSYRNLQKARTLQNEALLEKARDDLAFMRALVEPTDNWQKQFGETYFAAGLCYCAQMLLHGGQFLGLAPSSGPVALAIGLGPTVVFLVLLVSQGLPAILSTLAAAGFSVSGLEVRCCSRSASPTPG